MFRLSNLLLNPKKAERHPFEMLVVGFFYASLSILLSLWIFPDYASLTMVFLTVLSSLYIIQGAIIRDEKKETKNSEKSLLKEHSRTIMLLLFLFLGFLLAFVVWTIILPNHISTQVFDLQRQEIENIRSITGKAISDSALSSIISNNLRVLLLSLLFAVFYGAGAILILAWNASIMGFVIGELARNTLGLSYLPLIFTKFFLHGIPEMIAYFIAALAGGIIFVTLVKGDFRKERLKKTILDISALIIISIIIIVISAFIEVYISSLI